MPAPDQIHPHYLRDRMAGETDEQYAARMKELDDLEAFLSQFATPKTLQA